LKEVHVKGTMTRIAAVAVVATLGLGIGVTPSAAAEQPAQDTKNAQTPKAAPTAQKKPASLTHLSGTSQTLLTARASRTQQSGAEPPSSPSGFFHSKRGVVTLALMGAGAGFTLWSIHHDREPVKSPVR
jgi:hypothetical protein